MKPNPQAELPWDEFRSSVTELTWDKFCNSVLNLITELSPCPLPILFVEAGRRGLQRFGDGTLGDVSQLIVRCVEELQARGLVQIDGGQLVSTAEARASKLDETMTNEKELQTQETQAQVSGDTEVREWREELQKQWVRAESKLQKSSTSD